MHATETRTLMRLTDFGAQDRQLVFLLFRNNSSNSPARIGNISWSTGDDMHVNMKHRLPGIDAYIDPYVEAGDR